MLNKTQFTCGRMAPWQQMLAALCFALCILLIWNSPAFATFNVGSLLGGQTGTGGSTAGNCESYHGLTNKVVLCIRYTIDQAAVAFFQDVFPIFSAAVTATLTIAVVLFGVMIAAGMLERPSRDGMVFLMKLAASGFLVLQIPYLYTMVVTILDGLVEAVTSFAATGFPAGHCQYLITTWDRVDCMLDILIGFEYPPSGTVTTNPQTGPTPMPSLSKGLLGFFLMSMGASVVGFVIGLVGLYVLVSLVFGIVKAIFLYITAVIGLVFMAMIGPMFMPLVMFTSTRVYFDAFVKIIISFLLQVAIVFAYLVFMTIAIDTLVYSGNNSFMRTLVGNADFNDSTYEVEGRFNMNLWLELKNEEVVQNQSCGTDVNGRTERLIEDTGPNTRIDQRLPGEEEAGLRVSDTVVPVVRETTDDLLEAGEEMGILSFGDRLPSINWDCMEQLSGLTGTNEIDSAIFIRMLTLAVMMFLFKSMLDYIPLMANDLSGGYYTTPNLYGHVNAEGNPIRQALETPGNTITQSIQQTVGRITGGRNL